MKKLIALLLACLLLSAMVVTASANNLQYNEGTVPTTNSTIAVDGQRDDAYDLSLPININNPQLASYNYIDGEDPTGVAYLLLSNDYSTLYVFFHVDDYHMNDAEEEERPWQTDGVEIFIDPTNASTMTEADDPTEEDAVLSPGGVQLQYRMNLSERKTSYYRIHTNGAYEEATSNEALNDSYEAVVGDVSWGEYYEIEFAIDLTAYKAAMFGGVTCGADTQLGIQLMINDIREETGNLCGNVLNENSTVVLNTHRNDDPWVWRADEWNYVVLGASDYVPPVVTPPTPDNKKDDTDKGGATTPKTADGMFIAAAALIVSAGCAVVVLKKRK